MSKIYINTYAKYNNGQAGGDWLDAEDYADKEAFIEACKELHKDESDPELMFQDYEYFPKVFYSEVEIDPRLWDYIAMSTYDREIIDAWVSENVLSDDEILQDILDRFTGSYESWEDYAVEMTEGCYDIPSYLDGYIDYEKMGRDMMLSSSGYTEYDGRIWLFEG